MRRDINMYTKSELRAKSEDELKELAKEHKVKLSKDGKPRDTEELISDILVETYPVSPLPRGRRTSIRGTIFTSLADEKGKPFPEGTDLAEVEQKLVTEFGISPEEAERSVKLYLWNMVRYYGYNIESQNGKKVKLSDRRRKKALADANKAEKAEAAAS